MHDTRHDAPVTRRLADFCSSLTYADLDRETVDDACLSILDTLAAGYAGRSREEGRRMSEFVAVYDGTGDVADWGGDLALLPELAALVNGTVAHVLEVDDGHRAASAHPGAAVVPAALAMAGEAEASGRDLVTAVVAGYEAMCAVGAAVQPSHRQRGFHATATTGCFGAATAVASLLDADTETTAQALGLAGTQAGGLFEFLEKGSMAKRFHPGRAAMAGIVAARAADAGVDGPDTILEGSDGFLRAFADDWSLEPFEALGDPPAVTERYVKPYPCCRHVHGPIDAAKRLLTDGLDPEDVEAIRVETYDNAAYHDAVEVSNLLDAQMSMPYALAVTLTSGDARLDQFDPPRSDERVRDLMTRTEVVGTEEMNDRYPAERPAKLIVVTAGGDRLTETVATPLGSPENPLSRDDFETKFHDLTDDALPLERREDLLEQGFEMADLDSATAFVRSL